MRQVNWELLHTFETIARLGSLTAAARALGVSQSTVSRQLSRLEEDAGSPLIVRETPIRLSDRGIALREALKPMAMAAVGVADALDRRPSIQGLVTIATVGELLRWVLVNHLPKLAQAHPDLELKILAGSEVASLASGEADIALRFAKPTRGDLVAQRLHTEHYGFFVGQTLNAHQSTDWLGLAGSLAHLPEQRAAEIAFEGRRPRFLLEDVESLAKAVQANLGVAVLSKGLAASYKLRAVEPEDVGASETAIPSRGLWLVVHSSKQKLPKVRAVATWLRSALGESTQNAALSRD